MDNSKYKTEICKFYPNCYKGNKCTYIHNNENEKSKDLNIEEDEVFNLVVREINKFVNICKEKPYIKSNVDNNFWTKELKYFQNLNEYLNNIDE